jgi:hypothetical protein
MFAATFMAFEEDFDELEQMLLAKSTDYEKLRHVLREALKSQNYDIHAA